MKQRDRENLNPTPAAVAAMYIYSDQYADQSGGSMDFWENLPPWQKSVCEDAVNDIKRAAAAHGA